MKSRKPHRCDACEGRIESSVWHATRAGVSSDGFYRMRFHAECENATHRWDDWDWEMSGGGLDRPANPSPILPSLPLL